LKKGEGYQAERRQLSKVITYGMPEKSSVDLFHMILLKVILPQEPKNFTFPRTNERIKKTTIILFGIVFQIEQIIENIVPTGYKEREWKKLYNMSENQKE